MNKLILSLSGLFLITACTAQNGYSPYPPAYTQVHQHAHARAGEAYQGQHGGMHHHRHNSRTVIAPQNHHHGHRQVLVPQNNHNHQHSTTNTPANIHGH